MMKRTIHEGSVSYSQTLPNPQPGEGKHFKAPTKEQRHRRNIYRFRMYVRESITYLNKQDSQQNAKYHMASVDGKSVSE